MNKISFYDTKSYDKIYFEQLKEKYECEIEYHEAKLNKSTAVLSKGCDCVCAFVNDELDKDTLEVLYNYMHLVRFMCYVCQLIPLMRWRRQQWECFLC